MEFEQLLTRYFEIEKVLKNGNISHTKNEIEEMKGERDKLYSGLFKTFMVVRIKLQLNPDMSCHSWLENEYNQLIEIQKLLGNINDI